MTQSGPNELFDTSRNCWRVEQADRVAVIIDADEYFRRARAAMLKAKRRIMMVGWDFDARIALDRTGDELEGPDAIGPFIQWLVTRNKDLDVYILRWDVGAVKTIVNPQTLATLARWIWHPRISIKLDGHHPTAGSHHQKIVVIDDRLAFCGGIDMTGDRWDTREHLEDNSLRRKPNGNAYGPWHDATTALDGAAAAALGDLCRERWARAGRTPLAPVSDGADCWPDDLAPHFENVPVAIARTQPTMEDQAEIAEIEHLFVDMIAQARTAIYIESQYFASRRIALAIVRRLDEPDGPEVAVVTPLSAEGWIEPIAMDTARAQLVQALRRRDHAGRFRIYHPFAAGGTPIYVHAKVLIVDDRLLRIGSSNMNNRSMRLDTECDVCVDAAMMPSDSEARASITGIRASLIAEHLGVGEGEVAAMLDATGSLLTTIERLRRPESRTLRPYEVPNLSEVEAFLAENEILDPEGPDAMFESLAKSGLFRGW